MARSTGFSLWILALVALLGTLPAARAGEFSARDVYREAATSVVMVYARLGGSTSSTGTGTVVSKQGHVLTNAHVVHDAQGAVSREIAVFFKPPLVTGDLRHDLAKGHRATVVAHNEALDLVVLALRDGLPHSVEPVAFADSDEIEIGESVAAIGHPGGGGLWTLTTGTISSARKRGDLDVFQTDAAINPGNSGGPLLDADARMVGLNTFVVRLSDSGLPLEGLNYSLRANAVRTWLERHGVSVALRGRRATLAAAPSPPPAAVTPAPKPAPAPAAPERNPADTPRRFRGSEGEEMFGVPDRDFSHDEMQGELWGRTRRNAADAFRELDEGW